MPVAVEDCEPPAAKSNRPGEDADDEGGAVDNGEDDDEEGPDWTESEAVRLGWNQRINREYGIADREYINTNRKY